mmetsp:Transcript_72502/g.235513  ORF Transcript_72502/g.235513 Transcript_72502/m.235513 type:complete len:260 (-) Transcript_72502:976-1755(-)
MLPTLQRLAGLLGPHRRAWRHLPGGAPSLSGHASRGGVRHISGSRHHLGGMAGGSRLVLPRFVPRDCVVGSALRHDRRCAHHGRHARTDRRGGAGPPGKAVARLLLGDRADLDFEPRRRDLPGPRLSRHQSGLVLRLPHRRQRRGLVTQRGHGRIASAGAGARADVPGVSGVRLCGLRPLVEAALRAARPGLLRGAVVADCRSFQRGLALHGGACLLHGGLRARYLRVVLPGTRQGHALRVPARRPRRRQPCGRLLRRL